ncbi:MAG: hypothetical protein IJM30_07155 [Thermoguttaceae bacterium]|nr:hypothetical protein [Thermoguttaceae bacterium]
MNSSETTSFAPEASPKPSRRCAETGRPFVPGEKIYSTLYEEDGAVKRRDVCAAAWRSGSRPKNVLARWSTIVRDEDAANKPKLAPNEALTALFVSLADKPDQAALRYVLALLLARRRVLRFDYDENATFRSASENADSIYVYSPRNEIGYSVPVVEMSPERIEEVQARLIELIEDPSAALPETARDEEPEPEPERPRREPSAIDPQARLDATFLAFDYSEIAEAAASAARATLGR